MPAEVIIYESGFWKLWTYQPQPGSFVLDFSQLDGSDVLGDGSDGLAVADYPISSVIIQQGAGVEFGVVHTVAPSTAQVTLNVKGFTADQINDFFVGTEVLIGYDNQDGTSDPFTQVFYGKIESVNVEFVPGEDYSTITVSCLAISADYLNVDIVFQKNEIQYKDELIKSATLLAGFEIETDFSAYHYKGTAKESKSLGEWVTDLALCDFMQMRDFPIPSFVSKPNISDKSTWIVRYHNRPYFAITKQTLATSGTLDGNVIKDIELGWSGAGSPTGVTLTNYTDETIVYQYGSTVSGAGGSVSYVNTVDVKNLTEMQTIGTDFLAMNKKFTPLSVSTIVATNYQPIEFRATILNGTGGVSTAEIYPIGFYSLGETITIDLPNYGIDEQDMIIVGRTIEVTPDNWTTTYNLWKGFTN